MSRVRNHEHTSFESVHEHVCSPCTVRPSFHIHGAQMQQYGYLKIAIVTYRGTHMVSVSGSAYSRTDPHQRLRCVLPRVSILRPGAVTLGCAMHAHACKRVGCMCICGLPRGGRAASSPGTILKSRSANALYIILSALQHWVCAG